jgi:hypothetical protein
MLYYHLLTRNITNRLPLEDCAVACSDLNECTVYHWHQNDSGDACFLRSSGNEDVRKRDAFPSDAKGAVCGYFGETFEFPVKMPRSFQKRTSAVYTSVHLSVFVST